MPQSIAPRRGPTGWLASLLAVGLSLVLNVVLAARWLHPVSALTPPDLPSPSGGSGVDHPPGGASETDAGRTLAGTNAPFPFHWRQIESADYRQYIANLRAVACPEQVIRDLVAADLNQHFRARVQAIWQARSHPYWRKFENDQPSSTQVKELMALDRQQAESFKELFGESMSGQQLIDTIFLQIQGSERELVFLPAERRDAALRLLGDTGLEDRETAARNTGVPSASEMMAEKIKLLAQVLTPEELDEFRLRNSPGAQTLRTATQYFDCTPAEFKLLLDASAASADQAGFGNLLDRSAAVAVVRQVLGEDRATDFAHVSDLFYINARNAVAEQQLPLAAADQAWQITRDARTAADAVANDASLAADERNRQLQVLQDKARQQLTEVLGERGARPVWRDLNTIFVVARGKHQP